jgi:hypothetical protein
VFASSIEFFAGRTSRKISICVTEYSGFFSTSGNVVGDCVDFGSEFSLTDGSDAGGSAGLGAGGWREGMGEEYRTGTEDSVGGVSGGGAETVVTTMVREEIAEEYESSKL